MFTGIVEELGTVSKIKVTNNSMQLTLAAKNILVEVKLGDSIAVNGVCLTVTAYTDKDFSVDVMPETLKATTLGKLQQGAKVNLERALAIGGRLGGHFVSGHVDGIGIIQKVEPLANAIYYMVKLDSDLLHYCMNKGAIAVDGTSLTIFGIDGDIITLSLITHTLNHSVLGLAKVGDQVNIECDMLAKYVANLLFAKSDGLQVPTKLDQEFLIRNGFI